MSVGELEKMENDDLSRLIHRDTLEGIYSPESTDGLIFDRELVQFSSARFAKLMALRSELQASLAQDGRYRELIELNDMALIELMGNVAAFARADRFTPEARSDAAAVLADQLPRLAPQLSKEGGARLREIVRQAAESPGADPQLRTLPREW